MDEDDESKRERDTRNDRDDNRNRWWLPFLLLPVAFYFGWLANDAARTADNSGQGGVGGGPNSAIESPTPTDIPGGNILGD